LTEELLMVFCYIVYHYCIRFDRGLVHVAVVTLSSILFKVWQRSGSRCDCYIVYHYCLRFDRGVVHVVVVILSSSTVWGLTEEWFMLLLYCLPLMFKVWQRSGSCCGCYIVYHYYLRYDRGVPHVVVVVILSTITV
jgi:hypothetical protein